MYACTKVITRFSLLPNSPDTIILRFVFRISVCQHASCVWYTPQDGRYAFLVYYGKFKTSTYVYMIILISAAKSVVMIFPKLRYLPYVTSSKVAFIIFLLHKDRVQTRSRLDSNFNVWISLVDIFICVSIWTTAANSRCYTYNNMYILYSHTLAYR